MEEKRRLLIKNVGLGLLGLGFSKNKPNLNSSLNLNSIDIDKIEPIMLRSNENPYGPSALVTKELQKNLSSCNRYHWEITSKLISSIATKNKIKEENVLIGAGSTEILDLISSLFKTLKGNFIIPDPCYDYWTSILENSDLQKIKIPLNTKKKIDLLRILSEINNETKLIYLCNPNNPSGTFIEIDQILDFISKVPKNIHIIIDEAYLEYSKKHSSSRYIFEYENLIIVKTFSKIYGLAGARIGYAISNKNMIEKLATHQSSPNSSTSVLSRISAITALQDYGFIEDCIIKNDVVKNYTVKELTKLSIVCIPSETNFIYFSINNFNKNYFQILKDHNIEGTKIYEENGKWTRITIGRMEEMQYFIKALNS